MKAVLLAAGLGSRMFPATKHQNKHLLPVYSQDGAVPMIYYPLHTLIASGLTDILIISSREHCGRIMETLSDGYDFGCDFSYKIQDTQHVHMGIASALKIAKGFTNNEKFAMILGDNFFENAVEKDVEWFSNNLVCQTSLFLKEVEDIHRFGCATLIDGKVSKIVEKPKEPESNWAVTGMYFYTPHVYEVADTIQLSDRKELEITDINDYYCKKGTANGTILQGFWSDMGTTDSMLRTETFLRQINYHAEFKAQTLESKLA